MYIYIYNTNIYKHLRRFCSARNIIDEHSLSGISLSIPRAVLFPHSAVPRNKWF